MVEAQSLSQLKGRNGLSKMMTPSEIYNQSNIPTGTLSGTALSRVSDKSKTLQEAINTHRDFCAT